MKKTQQFDTKKSLVTIYGPDYRQGGHRAKYYRDIFRHNIRANEDFRTGGRAIVLWLDGHVTSIEETTGDDVPKRWYTGER